MPKDDVAEPVKVRAMGIVPGANPFEILLLIASAIVCATHLLGVAPPTSISSSLPSWAVKLWYANLGIGSLISIHGGLRPRKVVPGRNESTLLAGLNQYAFGWSYIGTALLTYGFVVIALHPESGLTTGIENLTWGAASMTRAYQVNRHTKRSRTTSGGGRHKHDPG